MARPRKLPPAPLPKPRDLTGMQAELYDLLASDLEVAVKDRTKLDKRAKDTAFALIAAEKRERQLRNQLAGFAPGLPGFEHIPLANGAAADAPDQRAA